MLQRRLINAVLDTWPIIQLRASQRTMSVFEGSAPHKAAPPCAGLFAAWSVRKNSRCDLDGWVGSRVELLVIYEQSLE